MKTNDCRTRVGLNGICQSDLAPTVIYTSQCQGANVVCVPSVCFHVSLSLIQLYRIRIPDHAHASARTRTANMIIISTLHTPGYVTTNRPVTHPLTGARMLTHTHTAGELAKRCHTNFVSYTTNRRVISNKPELARADTHDDTV